MPRSPAFPWWGRTRRCTLPADLPCPARPLPGADCQKTFRRCRRGRSPSDFYSCKPALPADGWLFERKAKSLRDRCFSLRKNSGRKATWLFVRKANRPPAKPAYTNESRRGCGPSDTSRRFFDSLGVRALRTPLCYFPVMFFSSRNCRISGRCSWASSRPMS